MFMGCASQPEQQEPIQTEEVSSMETTQEETEQLVDDIWMKILNFKKQLKTNNLRKAIKMYSFKII